MPYSLHLHHLAVNFYMMGTDDIYDHYIYWCFYRTDQFYAVLSLTHLCDTCCIVNIIFMWLYCIEKMEPTYFYLCQHICYCVRLGPNSKIKAGYAKFFL